MLLSFDQCPLKAFLSAVDVKAFAILPRGVEQKPPNVGCDVGIFQLDVARLDSKLVPRFTLQLLANGPRAQTRNVFRLGVHQPQHRAHYMRGIVHGNHPLPIVGPAVHILRVRSLHVLNFAQVASVVQFFDEKLTRMLTLLVGNIKQIMQDNLGNLEKMRSSGDDYIIKDLAKKIDLRSFVAATKSVGFILNFRKSLLERMSFVSLLSFDN